MAHYINGKKVSGSPGAIPNNIVFRGGIPSEIGEELPASVDKANSLSVSAGSNIQPVYFNEHGVPVAIDFIPADSRNVLNNNLLINPDFKINQRGLTIYAGSYGVDRWAYSNISDGDTVEVVENGVRISCTNPEVTRPYIRQFIEPGVIIPGEMYTISVCVDGKVYSKSGVLSETNYITIDSASANNIHTGVNFDVPAQLYRAFVQVTVNKPSMTINWMKLEPGVVATPFVTPDPTLELLKCQRYYRELSGEFIYTRGGAARGFYNVVERLPLMRTIPTVTYTGVLNDVTSIFNADVVAGNTKNTIKSISFTPTNESYGLNLRILVYLKDTASMAVAGTISNEMLVVKNGAKIILDAELH